MSSNHGVVKMNVWFVNLVEGFNGGGDVSAEGKSGDEFGDNEWVIVKIGFVYESMKLV